MSEQIERVTFLRELELLRTDAERVLHRAARIVLANARTGDDFERLTNMAFMVGEQFRRLAVHAHKLEQQVQGERQPATPPHNSRSPRLAGETDEEIS